MSSLPTGSADISDKGFADLVRRLDAAWEVSLEEGLSFYTDDPAMHIWDDTPVDESGKPAYALAIAPLMGSLASARNEPRGEISVIRAGDMVVTLSLIANSFTFKDGRSNELLSRQTLVWRRINDRWLILHEHTSRVPEADPAQKHTTQESVPRFA